MKPKFSGRKEITKIKAEVNIKETKKTIEKIKSILTEPSGMPLSSLCLCVCVCVCVCVHVNVCVLVTQSCLTLCSPIDCSLPGSSVHGTHQARILE